MNFLGKKSIKKGFVGQLFSPKIRTRNLSYKTKKWLNQYFEFSRQKK